MKKPIFTLLFLLALIGFSPIGKSQTIIAEINGITITPANPDPTDSIFIQFSGFLYDSCVVVNSAIAVPNASAVNVNLQFETTMPPGLHCIPTLIPWDTVFNIGPMPPGTYPIFMSGPNYLNTLTFFDLQVMVPTPSCTDNSGTIWVTNTNDQGIGSLRNAINCANSELGANLIRFNIFGTGDHRINVGSVTGDPLPTLTDPATTIDGTTQPGYGTNSNNSPKIILDGAFHSWTAPINALGIQGNDCKIFALEIVNFPDDGIDVMGADNVVIGSFGAGNIIYNNGSAQDYFPDVPNTGPWNGCGIVVRDGASACSISGNIIGSNENLDTGLGNEWCGIIVRSGADHCQIGGLAQGQGNIIVENETGVRVSNSDNCLIQRNLFSCNALYGIEIPAGGNNNIPRPKITSALVNGITGTSSIQNGTVEVFVNDIAGCGGTPCQGKVYLGTAISNNGAWGLLPPFANGVILQGGERITATVSQVTRTSEFSDCKVVAGVSACTNADGSIEVTTTDDEGPGSLREAIECANNTLGANLIKFNIPGTGPHVINVGGSSGDPLPTLTDDATVIDGSTQTGFGNTGPQIILDGQVPVWTAPINALFIQGDFCEIYALEVVNFPDDGIDLTGANYCKIGGIDKGNVIFNNGAVQDFFPDAPNTGPWNGCGIVLKGGASYNEIKGNKIGTDFGETLEGGNEYCGIIIASGSDFNFIGDSLKDGRNIIAHNEQGIRISGSTASNTLSRNSVYCNSIEGVNLVLDANSGIGTPSITSAGVDTIAGSTPLSSGQVEVFLNDDSTCANAPCQGKTFLGKATVDAGTWTLLSPFANGVLLNGGESVTVVFTDVSGNSSEFSTCISVAFPCNIQFGIIAQVDASCGLDNGSITVETLNGIPPYLYDIGNGLTIDSIFTGLAPGAYTITVTDLTGCSRTVNGIINNTPVPTVAEGINIDASCLQANGSFSATASDGVAPYLYDIGNGPVSDTLFSNLAAGNYTLTVTDDLGCTATLNTTINDVGLPTIIVDEVVDATCGDVNGSITVLGAGGTPPYSYDIGNGAVGNPVFSDLSPGNYTLTITDDNACTSTVVGTVVNIGVMPVAGFTFVDLDATVSFSNSSTDALTYAWDFGDGTTAAASDPMHTYTQDGSFQACLTAINDCGQDVFCQTIDIVVPLAEVTVSGEILTPNGNPVGLVEVNCTNVPSLNTLSDGYFEFNNLGAGMDYTITPHKNTNPKNGLSVLDMALIQRHLLFIDTLDSPYKMIAADVSNDLGLSILDIVTIQRLLLFVTNDFPNNTSWRFVPADHVFNNPLSPFSSPFPESIVFPGIMADAVNQDFVAVKIGDVSEDADPMNLVSNTKVEWTTRDQLLEAGSEINVRIDVQYFEEIIAMQADIEFDPSVLELVEIEGGEMSNLHWGESRFSEGLIPVIWHDVYGAKAGQNLDPGTTVLNLTFKVHQSGQSLSEVLALKASNPRNIAYDKEEEANPVYLFFDTATPLTQGEFSAFKLGQNQPNPFSNTTLIPFYLPKGGELSLKIYDVAGRLVESQEAYFAKGNQSIELDAQVFPGAGLYFYELNFAEQSLLRRMIVQ